jgi:hypothetical protein
MGRWNVTEREKKRLIPHAAPNLAWVDLLIGIERLGPCQEYFGRLGVDGIRDAAIVDGAHGSALRFIEMADAFGAAIMGDDVNAVSDALPITHVIPLALGVAPRLKNGLIRAFRQAGPAGDAFIGD